MQNTADGFVPSKGLLSELLMGNSKFHDPNEPHGTMPISQWGKRIIWHLEEREELSDSSDMDQDDWVYVAEEIKKNYDSYDGFVVIQGTDTMTYTASALSYMCKYLRKSVIVTGSQVPMVILPNDAESNLFGSICIAGHFEIPEVCVFFNGHLNRGNRTSKFDAVGYNAFVSHNYPPLLVWGPEIHVSWESVRPPIEVEFLNHPFSIATRMCNDVAVLRLFPGITESFLKSVLQPPLRGCVLMTYGQGNVSLRAKHVLRLLGEASGRGMLLCNISQCNRGSVTAAYATGRVLLEVGVQPGHDMTCEAALTKLSFLLGSVDNGEYTIDEARAMISKSIRGECSAPKEVKSFSFRDGSFVSALVKSMEGLLSPDDTVMESSLTSAMFPVLLCSAAAQADFDSMRTLLQLTGPGIADYHNRTALHVACKKHHLDVVKFLLEQGAPVNALDNEEKTPLDLVGSGCPEITDYMKSKGGKKGVDVKEKFLSVKKVDY
jgi:lysophospholipase